MVHIIPLFTDQRRGDPGNAAPPEAAGPLDPYWQEVADHYARRMARQQAFDTEIAERRLDGEIASAEADTVANAPADGEGLHHAMYGEVDPFNGRVVLKGRFDTLFDNFVKQAPPELRAGLASRKPALREAGSVRMAMQQLQRRAQYEQDQLAAAQAEELATIAKSDPDDHTAFDASRHVGLDLIAKMNLDPESRQQAEAAWRERAARTRVEALIARDPGRATEMLSAAPAAGDRQAVDPAVDPRADLSPDGIRQLLRQARAATMNRLIDARASIDLASQNAPDEIANTGSYSGTMPSPADFAAVYGIEEGGKQHQEFGRKIDAGRQAFGMRTMPNQAIHAVLRDVEPAPGSSKEDQARYQITTAAALKILGERRADPAGYVRDVFPDVEAAWSAVTGQAGKLGNNDQEAYNRAIALSVAAQRQLGVENPQPLPKAVVQSITDGFGEKGVSQADRNTVLGDLLAAGTDPATRDALSQQLDQAGFYQPADIDPITTAATGEQSPSSAGPGEPKSAVRQAAEDFGNYLSQSFESLARAPHDIRLALRDLHDSPWDFLEQLPVNPGSGAIAEGRLASEAAGEAVAKGLAIVRDGTGKFARPLEKFATSGSRAKSGLAADAAVAREAVETKSLVKAAEDAASRVGIGAKLKKSEVLEIIQSIARDPSKVKYQGASLGRAASKNYRKTFLDANPNLQGEVIVHHAAERQIWEKFPGIVAADEEHSLQNLRGIPKSLDKLLHKVILRYEWDEFYEARPQPTRQQVLDYVSYIDRKYGHLFNPPIGE